MKYNGEKIEGATTRTIVIPLDKDYVIKAQAVLDYKEFQSICPEPTPPTVVRPGGEKSVNYEDQNYKQKVTKWYKLKTDYLFWKSLQASEHIEFETVDPSDPDTWGNVQDELSQVFPNAAVGRIYDLVMDVNALDQGKIEEATKSFLHGQGADAEKAENSQNSELNDMQSGKLAKDSE